MRGTCDTPPTTHEHANAPHALALLRACRERPRSRHTAEHRDELASVAVGTPITGRPPHRTVHAAFPHTALTSGPNGECLPHAVQRVFTEVFDSIFGLLPPWHKSCNRVRAASRAEHAVG